MSAADLRREEEALDWARRLADPSFTAWEAHRAWLECDRANPAAFDRALLLMESATEGLGPKGLNSFDAPASAANDNWSRWAHRKVAALTAAAVALAASVAALVSVNPPSGHRITAYRIASAPGKMRALLLADGSRVTLNGASRIQLDHAHPRSIRLDAGEAFFSVRHDVGQPFEVIAGDATFQDVGTAFDVKRLPGSTEIAVREGAVLFDPEHTALRLDKGQAMVIAQRTAAVRQVNAATVGAWRTGRLIYQDATFRVVAGDIERAIGAPVYLDGSLAELHFSGVIIIDDNRRRMFDRIGAVMRIAIKQDRRGWRLRRIAG